jgi:hypothetical protein
MLESTIPPLPEVIDMRLLRGTARIFHQASLLQVKEALLAATELGEESSTLILQFYRDKGLHAATTWESALELLKNISPHRKKEPWKFHEHQAWKERTLARFRMGTLPTQDWAHLLGLTPTPTCRHCGVYVETTTHLLQACPTLDYSALRSAWRKTSISTPGLSPTVNPQELQALLNDHANIYHLDLEEGLIQFVKDNNLFTRRRHTHR